MTTCKYCGEAIDELHAVHDSRLPACSGCAFEIVRLVEEIPPITIGNAGDGHFVVYFEKLVTGGIINKAEIKSNLLLALRAAKEAKG